MLQERVMDFAAVSRRLHKPNRTTTLVDLNAAMQNVIADAESMPGGGLIVIRSRTTPMRTAWKTAVEIEISDSRHGRILRLSLPTCTTAPPLSTKARMGAFAHEPASCSIR
jgi:hypothetical protein